MSKVVIVTGASRGIGLAIAKHLLRPLQSCNVVAVARSKEPLEALQKETPDRVQILSGDLSDLSLGQKAVELAISQWGRLDGLVINHGTLDPVERIADANLDAWRHAFDVNALSAVALVKAALPKLREVKGKIIMTSSGAAVKGTSAWGAYGIGKAAINSLTWTLGKEEPDIVTVAIRPGVVDTEMQVQLTTVHQNVMDKEDAERFATQKKEGKLLRPEEPGNVMARLVLEAPSNLSGQFLNWNADELKDFQDV